LNLLKQLALVLLHKTKTHQRPCSSSLVMLNALERSSVFASPILIPTTPLYYNVHFFLVARPPFCNCDSRDLFQLEGSLYRRFSSGFELDHTRYMLVVVILEFL
jgi:hypothetical protein